MTPDIILFIILLAAAFVLYVFEVFSVDVTTLLLLIVLTVLGYLDIQEAISGFSNSAVIIVATMLVLGQALTKTGILEIIIDRISRTKLKSKSLSIGIFLLGMGIISAFMNNTTVVAIFLPFTIRIAKVFQMSPSKLLIPLSYMSILGGCLTLIGTSTNILANSIVVSIGEEPMRMFEFTKMGILFVVFGGLYLLTIGIRMIPSRVAVSSLTRSYHLAPYITEGKIADGSPLIGKTIVESNIHFRYDVTILAIIQEGIRYDTNLRFIKLKQGDMVLIQGNLDSFLELREKEKILLLTDVKMSQEELTGQDTTLVEGLIPYNSSLIGRTLKDFNFRKNFGAFVIAIRREGKTIHTKIAHTILQFADTLLIFLPKIQLEKLKENPEVTILQEYDVKLHKHQYWWLAILIIPLIMLGEATGVVDILLAALIGVILLLLSKSVTIQEVYNSINWTVIVTIACFIPIGIVLQRTGTADLIANLLVGLGQSFPPDYVPYVAVGLTYFITMVLTMMISNNATVVMMIPIAVAVANQLHVDVRPFIFASCFGASTEFMIPVGYQTHLMVYGPGGYRFSDFVKVGFILDVICIILGAIFIPIFWPF